MGHFRTQMVSEYQNTVMKIVSDLAAIRKADGGNLRAGLSADAVASLFISRINEGLKAPSPVDHGPLADLNSAKDSR